MMYQSNSQVNSTYSLQLTYALDYVLVKND
jgi:hypothetical protein